MTVATDSLRQTEDQRRMTLKEFLTYDDGTDARYELWNGVLVEMGAESRINIRIAIFLIQHLALLGIRSDRIGIKEKVEVRSTFVATARDADLIIHSEESSLALEGRSESCLTMGDPNPLIVIEIVSPGRENTDNYQRDYVQKPKEYADRGIPEFWQIDPSRAYVRVGTLIDGSYEFETIIDKETIVSPTFPELNLTAAIVLAG
jgi:Uma2 family endonuclease